jgi:hypothetical protein
MSSLMHQTYGDGDGFSIGEIIVNAPVSWTSGNTLTLKAGHSISVNADLDGVGGDIVFSSDGYQSRCKYLIGWIGHDHGGQPHHCPES